jgi:hypothetical protein
LRAGALPTRFDNGSTFAKKVLDDTCPDQLTLNFKFEISNFKFNRTIQTEKPKPMGRHRGGLLHNKP